MKKRTKEILEILDREFGTDYKCYLNYEAPWQLLAATMLSAQCTDARVNIVTADLFQKYPSAEALADADLKELEEDIMPIENLISFAESKEGAAYFGGDAANIAAHAKEIKNNGGIYCDCPACAAAAEILKHKEELLG